MGNGNGDDCYDGMGWEVIFVCSLLLNERSSIQVLIFTHYASIDRYAQSLAGRTP